MISDEEAQQLMCPPEKSEEPENPKKAKTLERMNSFHVGPVKLPHPVRMPNGRVSNSRASSEDYSKTSNHPKHVSNTLYSSVRSSTLHSLIVVTLRQFMFENYGVRYALIRECYDY